jgi:hypothetical protein
LDYGCSTFETPRILLGNPFWNPVHERLTMSHSLHRYCLPKEFKETFIEVRVRAITRTCEVSAILLATAPGNKSALSSSKNISILAPVRVSRSEPHEKLSGDIYSQGCIPYHFYGKYAADMGGRLGMDGEYQVFSVEAVNPNDLFWEFISFGYGVGHSDTQPRDILCSLSCFGWCIIRLLENGDSFSLVGRAFLPRGGRRIWRRSVLSESPYAPSTCLTY